MQFIIDNWPTLFLCVVMLAWAIIMIIRSKDMSKEELFAQLRGWLLQAVIIAEQQFGGGTGKLKLSFVYDEFCRAMPWLAKVIPFSVFSEYVDKVLVEMRELLSKNGAIASIVEPKGEN